MRKNYAEISVFVQIQSQHVYKKAQIDAPTCTYNHRTNLDGI